MVGYTEVERKAVIRALKIYCENHGEIETLTETELLNWATRLSEYQFEQMSDAVIDMMMDGSIYDISSL
jgi:hypothetical protein